MADDAQRRTSTGLRSGNRLKAMLGESKSVACANFEVDRADKCPAAASARGHAAGAGPCWTRSGRGGDRRQVLVVVQSAFTLISPRSISFAIRDSERLQGRVQFTAIRMMEEKLAANGRRT